VEKATSHVTVHIHQCNGSRRLSRYNRHRQAIDLVAGDWKLLFLN